MIKYYWTCCYVQSICVYLWLEARTVVKSTHFMKTFSVAMHGNNENKNNRKSTTIMHEKRKQHYADLFSNEVKFFRYFLM